MNELIVNWENLRAYIETQSSYCEKITKTASTVQLIRMIMGTIFSILGYFNVFLGASHELAIETGCNDLM